MPPSCSSATTSRLSPAAATGWGSSTRDAWSRRAGRPSCSPRRGIPTPPAWSRRPPWSGSPAGSAGCWRCRASRRPPANVRAAARSRTAARSSTRPAAPGSRRSSPSPPSLLSLLSLPSPPSLPPLPESRRTGSRSGGWTCARTGTWCAATTVAAARRRVFPSRPLKWTARARGRGRGCCPCGGSPAATAGRRCWTGSTSTSPTARCSASSASPAAARAPSPGRWWVSGPMARGSSGSPDTSCRPGCHVGPPKTAAGCRWSSRIPTPPSTRDTPCPPCCAGRW